jgi:hypothetical protein
LSTLLCAAVAACRKVRVVHIAPSYNRPSGATAAVADCSKVHIAVGYNQPNVITAVLVQ